LDNPEVKTCWCPCGCGCQDHKDSPCGLLLENGLCSDCVAGKHEVPPDGAQPNLDDLITLHLEILHCYIKAKKERLEEEAKQVSDAENKYLDIRYPETKE